MKIEFRNKALDLSLPAVMGILNVTPDSFYDGGNYSTEKAILERAETMLAQGADIIDIGACSTRPGAEMISESEELKRLLPAIKAVKKHFAGAVISADTFQGTVAAKAVEEGADMINDVSGGTMDKKMFEIASQLKVPYILMHLKGTPLTMQKNPVYQNVVKEVTEYFKEKVFALKKLGVKQIILDPGFGFGKTTEHNYTLLKNLGAFKEFELPILAGMSRKGMIYKTLEIKPEEALNGTTAANIIALINGANILRVHDVKEAKQAVKIINFAQ